MCTTEDHLALVALVVDDDDIFRNRLCRALTDRGWEAAELAMGQPLYGWLPRRVPISRSWIYGCRKWAG